MGRVSVYIDGFNVYHAIDALKLPKLKWLNYKVLAASLLRNGEDLTDVHFFTAVLSWNHEKQARHRNYIAALKAVGVIVHEANFKRSRRFCQEQQRYCRFYEEKQTDVAIAITMVSDAIGGRFDRGIILTADSDQIPTARFIAGLPGRSLTLLYPPGRGSHARDLGNVITDRKELTAGHLATCLLPRTVVNLSGNAVAHCPAIYQA